MEVTRLHQIERAAVAAQRGHYLIEYARVGRQYALQHRNDYDAGQKVRQVRYRLSYLLEALRAYLVEQQRQYYRKRELQYALYKAYLQRVPDEPPAVIALKEHVEVLPAHPRAAPYLSLIHI